MVVFVPTISKLSLLSQYSTTYYVPHFSDIMTTVRYSAAVVVVVEEANSFYEH